MFKMQNTDTAIPTNNPASARATDASPETGKPHDKAGLALAWIADRMPDWLWLRFEKKAQAHYERIPDCLTCHYWAARMRGWLDFVFVIAAFGLLFLCLKGIQCI